MNAIWPQSQSELNIGADYDVKANAQDERKRKCAEELKSRTEERTNR